MILVTQSFGKESEYRRVVFAILSYYCFSSQRKTKTILFTDSPNWFAKYFKDLPIEYILLTPEKMKSMRGGIDFLHRMKIALIEESSHLYPTENLLYFDSDTFFVADPSNLMQQLTPNKSYMHEWEYKFESIRNMPLPAGKTFQAFVQLIERVNDFGISTGKICIDAQMSSWNAGVMMLHQSHSRFLPDVYSLTDQFYPSTQNHASEQYAFSILLQTQTNLDSCKEVSYHYWYNIKKKIIDEYLADKLPDVLQLPTFKEKLDTVRSMVILLPNIFEKHLFTLKDNAVQSLNANSFKSGYFWAFKAIKAGAFKDSLFIKDVLYHLKRQLRNSL